MPDAVTATGIQVKSLTDLVNDKTTALQTIYGADINTSSDTPDGQAIAIEAQAGADVRELIVEVYNSFDPDKAVGTTLDARCAINGIQRKAGTYTVTPISIQTDRALTLYGLDQNQQTVYTVTDNAGNQWQLMKTTVFAAAGTQALNFQSATPGAVLTTPNTITIPVTVVLGVIAINNPTTYSVLGIAEESDSALRIRRQQSVALPSQGYLAGLIAALKNLNGISNAYVYENVTGATDANGIPSHSIWVIVAGTASNADIASAIYAKRNAGCGMKGAVNFVILQADGTSFSINWDVVTPVPLFIKFTASSLDGVNPPNVAAIRAGLVTGFVPNVAGQVNINDLAAAVRAIDPNTLVTGGGFSTSLGGTYTTTLTPSAKNLQFAVTAPNIIITPIVITPQFVSIARGGSQTITAAGGYGAYTWSFQTNASGGTINATTGAYVAGTTVGTDVIKVTDASSNSSTYNITVT